MNGKSSGPVVVRYSEAIAAEFGIGALAPFWSALLPAVMAQDPLLAARLAFHEHDIVLARQLLDRVDLDTLAKSDLRMWSDLLTAVAAPPEVFRVLRDRRNRGHLPREIMTDYARLAAQLGQELEYQAALVDIGRHD